MPVNASYPLYRTLAVLYWAFYVPLTIYAVVQYTPARWFFFATCTLYTVLPTGPLAKESASKGTFSIFHFQLFDPVKIVNTPPPIKPSFTFGEDFKTLRGGFGALYLGEKIELFWLASLTFGSLQLPSNSKFLFLFSPKMED